MLNKRGSTRYIDDSGVILCGVKVQFLGHLVNTNDISTDETKANT